MFLNVLVSTVVGAVAGRLAARQPQVTVLPVPVVDQCKICCARSCYGCGRYPEANVEAKDMLRAAIDRNPTAPEAEAARLLLKSYEYSERWTCAYRQGKGDEPYAAAALDMSNRCVEQATAMMA